MNEFKAAVVTVISLLGGIAACDGILEAFKPTTNLALIIGRIALASVNGVLAFLLTLVGNILVVAAIDGAFESIAKHGKKGEVHD